MYLSSAQNSKIKDVVALREKKERDRTGQTLVEGVREVMLAVEAKLEVESLFILDGTISATIEQKLRKALPLTTALYEVSEQVFDKISYGNRREGLLAVVKRPRRSLKDIPISNSSIFLIVESLEKPGNLGAVLRTADAAGIDGVIVCDPKVDIDNPNVIRSSLGTLFTVNVVAAKTVETINFLKNNKIRIAAADPKASVIYTKVDFKCPLAIVAGSEEKGLTDLWHRAADVSVKIPMKGKVDSLNTSVALSVLLYEALRQNESR